MITGIFALFAALPELLKLLNTLGLLAERILAWSKQHEIEKWISDLETTVDGLEKAKTSQEKLVAAKSLVDLIKGV